MYLFSDWSISVFEPINIFSNSKTLIDSTLGIEGLKCNSPGWIQTFWRHGNMMGGGRGERNGFWPRNGCLETELQAAQLSG